MSEVNGSLPGNMRLEVLAGWFRIMLYFISLPSVGRSLLPQKATRRRCHQVMAQNGGFRCLYNETQCL
jgi:hypothetical protein